MRLDKIFLVKKLLFKLKKLLLTYFNKFFKKIRISKKNYFLAEKNSFSKTSILSFFSYIKKFNFRITFFKS